MKYLLTLNEIFNFHIGDLNLNKELEPYYSDVQMSGRHTGHFGSGMYFSTYPDKDYNNKFKNNKEDHLIQLDNKLYRVNFDLYKNLYPVKSSNQARALFETLRELNRLCLTIYSYHENGKSFDSEIGKRFLIIKGNMEKLGLKLPPYKKFIEMTIDLGNKLNMFRTRVKVKDVKSHSTLFMEYNGFNGVNVSGIYGYDNLIHGSVIYDLSKVSKDLIKVKEKDIVHMYKGDINTNIVDYFGDSPFDKLKEKSLKDENIFSTDIYLDLFKQLTEAEQRLLLKKFYSGLMAEEVYKTLSEPVKKLYLLKVISDIKSGKKFGTRWKDAIIEDIILMSKDYPILYTDKYMWEILTYNRKMTDFVKEIYVRNLRKTKNYLDIIDEEDIDYFLNY